MKTRCFYPGDKWIYFKIYTPPLNANSILLECLAPLMAKITRKGLISQWFFIRYSDPNPHLRVRLEVTDINNLGEIIQQLNHALKPRMKSGEIFDLQIATYVRELERYGVATIEQCEKFFCNDTLSVIDTLGQKTDETHLIESSICWIDALLDSQCLTIEQKKSFTEKMYANYRSEFNLCPEQFEELKKFQRSHKTTFTNDVISSSFSYPLLKNGDNLFSEGIISSLIHMHVNRLFASQQRFMEFCIYFFINKAYDTILHTHK